MLLSLYDYIDNTASRWHIYYHNKINTISVYADQIKHSARMASVQPKMQELKRKYAYDKQTLNMKLVELIRKKSLTDEDVAVLVQMPIIFGLFALLRNQWCLLKVINADGGTWSIFWIERFESAGSLGFTNSSRSCNILLSDYQNITLEWQKIPCLELWRWCSTFSRLWLCGWAGLSLQGWQYIGLSELLFR